LGFFRQAKEAMDVQAVWTVAVVVLALEPSPLASGVVACLHRALPLA
jgi:hypothetical protein